MCGDPHLCFLPLRCLLAVATHLTLSHSGEILVKILVILDFLSHAAENIITSHIGSNLAGTN